ncbi:MAG: aminomethyl-transferring glycine dehydrogenase subunit GcvPB [Oscillospiraceae bacterium]|jgi:glycine dehydrogenase subunit 2|nr:aminomethyl-transferring glycine dehydrogenase subunit GcvPB [Oscillospiraceae bacterium]
MKLIFERSIEGFTNDCLPALDVPQALPNPSFRRSSELALPEVPECEIDRHYSELERAAHGVNNGFYPLGSCTMKYNPKINEEMAGLRGFTDIHPLQPLSTVEGALELLCGLEKQLCEISGMDAISLQPSAGAHGEFAGVLIIKAYHASRGDAKRTKIIVPDSAHGTNPASAAMNGFSVVSIPSRDGCVDVEALAKAAGDDTAGLMLTNPNTLGLFDPNILRITEIIHNAGGLCYYDGANMNALMGVARPGDMGFDVIHLNLHKTFSTPHGGGGPGGGAVGVKAFLSEFLPRPIVRDNTLAGAESSIGKVRSFYGNFLVCVRAYCYILSLGGEGIKEAAQTAVLNANYLMRKMPAELLPYAGTCMHEFVLSLKSLKKETGVSALDVAKALIDTGMHPPTMYFPLIVEEALMFEPTETEMKETLDNAAEAFRRLIKRSYDEPASMHDTPRTTPIGRPDETSAARNPIIKA